ncbi:MAG: tRNA lysidine(34) synthetase TilS [Syntrophobacter sp.]
MTKPRLSLADRSVEYIRKNGLISEGDHILAAVSGGPDSVALLDIFSRLKDNLGISRISIAHFDHRLRGGESDADREFVERLASRYGYEFRDGSADVRDFSREKRVSLEMAARECRHSFLKKAAEAAGAHKTALGHTAEDQAEEVLLRLCRGVGPAGLRAMLPETTEGIIRPLLFARREEVLEYLRGRGLAYREDSSNFEPFCQRNSLRLRVFPILREVFHPGVAATIARYAELARDEESWWDHQVRESWESCAVVSEDGAALELQILRGLHPALVRRLLRHGIEKIRGNLSAIQAVHLEPLFDMAFREMPGKSIRLPGGIEAVQTGGKLLIRGLADPMFLARGNAHLSSRGRTAGFDSRSGGADVERKMGVQVPAPGHYRLGDLVFEIAVTGGPGRAVAPSGGEEAFMDADKVKWPLLIRFWEPGDRFVPLGMKGSKKLQDFFTDAKVPRARRWRVPILCDSDKICWIAGYRIDDRVRTGPETRAILAARLVHSASEESGDA